MLLGTNDDHLTTETLVAQRLCGSQSRQRRPYDHDPIHLHPANMAHTRPATCWPNRRVLPTQ